MSFRNFIWSKIQIHLISNKFQSLHKKKTDNEDIVKMLIKNGIDVNLKDDQGWSSLNWAAFKANAKMVKILLDNGANPNIVDNDGVSPIIWAAKKRNF